MTDAERSPVLTHLALALVVLGLILIATSFASFSFLSKRGWTIEDSQAFAQVTRELHASTVNTSPSSADSERFHQKLESEFERLNSKLAQAQNEPRRWSHWLLWTGAAMTTAGAFVHLARGNE